MMIYCGYDGVRGVDELLLYICEVGWIRLDWIVFGGAMEWERRLGFLQVTLVSEWMMANRVNTSSSSSSPSSSSSS